MNALYYLIPVTLLLGVIGLVGFIWSLRSGQYEDLSGDASRALRDDAPLSKEDARRRRLAQADDDSR